MKRRENQFFVGRQRRRQDFVDRAIAVRYLLAHMEERINYSVAHGNHPIRGDTLTQEIVARLPRGRKMKCRGESYDTTIELLRPRRIEIVTAETGLDTGNRNPVHEARSGSRCRRRGIPLTHNPAIVLCLEYSFDLTSDEPELPRQTRLVCYVRAVIGNGDFEELEQTCGQFYMLSRPENIEFYSGPLES